MPEGTQFDILRVGIASPQEIRAWSRGEVKKPETINYRTFKPERDGLFCERIFGPTKDWECHCGKYKKVKFKGIICDRCGVEVTRSKVRRRRMGHIDLAAPVAHIWYVKGVPSPIALLLDMSPRNVEKVLYFASYVVTRANTGDITRNLKDIRQAVEEEIEEIKQGARANVTQVNRDLVELNAQLEAGDSETPVEDLEVRRKRLTEDASAEESLAAERCHELEEALSLLSQLEVKKLISDPEYRGLQKLIEAANRKAGKNFDSLFRVGLGAISIKELLERIDLEKLSRDLKKTIQETAGAKRARAIKRLEVVESFRKSKNRPDWMILDTIPVMPPELRPMVQLDGGRFATSDLNDLYRRIINRNNRLKRIMEIKAPESIVNHEKRLLQEAVDALIDNSRRSRPVQGTNGRPLKSLSDLLKGKEGRFRKNLLGKRVDYSGRSVIVVGPYLHLDECGLPKEMALELFKPFVMKRLVEKGYTTNIKTAKRMVDRLRTEVWDALEEVIKDHPVLLNRAPTLHRLGIQGFQPRLIDGKAIQLHPLVCPAFNADFDGDQMAVHVPLFPPAQAEVRVLMMSKNNLFSPADGRLVMSPEYDIVLGCYYLTQVSESEMAQLGRHRVYFGPQEAKLAHDLGELDLHAMVKIRMVRGEEYVETTVGRLVFNELLPDGMPYLNETMDKSTLRKVITDCYERSGNDRTVQLLDDIKSVGFRYATRAGLSISLTDMVIPGTRDEIIQRTEEDVEKINRDFHKGVISAQERERNVVQHWIRASDRVGDAILEKIDHFNPLYMMANSGARGSIKQISQIAGMRGLMTEPSGKFIEDLPIKHNFQEGLTLLEYFISTHGARKGLADTALRTADAGYLTRRLVDVSQDVIIREDDCGTTNGIEVSNIEDGREVIEYLHSRIHGRIALESIKDPKTGKVLVKRGEEITENMAQVIEDAGIKKVQIRSVLTCDSTQGVCSKCYCRDLSTGRPVEVGLAVGIIAAQSIGEPGTQLTMRTFHLGGVAQQYLTGVAEVKKRKQEALRGLYKDVEKGLVSVGGEEVQESEQKKAVQKMLKVLEESVRGLLRVVELFEARKPKGEAIISDVNGTVAAIETKGMRQVIVYSDPVEVDSDIVGKRLAEDVVNKRTQKIVAPRSSEVSEKVLEALQKANVKKVVIRYEYLVPYRGYLKVEEGDSVRAGDRLTEGPISPQRVLELKGVAGVQNYLVTEIQKVYKGQGVNINDKHVEVLVRQMLRKRKIIESGDTELLPGQVRDRFEFEQENARVREQGGQEATASYVLLGITEAALGTESFLSAASFQKTTKVLTNAATKGKADHLVGLKENVIIGRLIPAGTGFPTHSDPSFSVEGEEFEDDALELLTPDEDILLIDDEAMDVDDVAPKEDEGDIEIATDEGLPEVDDVVVDEEVAHEGVGDAEV
ncbi:MAG: DNA-directed RNA polymerase subunit beta' [Armatimonadetes bacterium CG07_land_8_20_14_0_80_59_28]|nr:MAG: DNA-directed RNA polymerase subunit beta' [Armatimonadetes bacterium CG07_land_8_20_14_0_80_59_28]PIX40290.1 MAG: DNA-directed RNA polymerase subunit beta' [Armatimonadetes bacterium CG_4_8_14_3_um_filter_58_9]